MDAHWGLMNACCGLIHSTWDTIGTVCLHVTAFQFVMQGAYVSVDAPDHDKLHSDPAHAKLEPYNPVMHGGAKTSDHQSSSVLQVLSLACL